MHKYLIIRYIPKCLKVIECNISGSVLGTTNKSQVIKSQSLAIFAFTPCQRRVNRSMRNPRFQPKSIYLTRIESYIIEEAILFPHISADATVTAFSFIFSP